jgi:hypothetical protein
MRRAALGFGGIFAIGDALPFFEIRVLFGVSRLISKTFLCVACSLGKKNNQTC